MAHPVHQSYKQHKVVTIFGDTVWRHCYYRPLTGNDVWPVN